MKIIGYAYMAALHCPDCARLDADVGILERRPPLQLGTDAHGLAHDLVDREGNAVSQVHNIDEPGEGGDWCDDCRVDLRA